MIAGGGNIGLRLAELLEDNYDYSKSKCPDELKDKLRGMGVNVKNTNTNN